MTPGQPMRVLLGPLGSRGDVQPMLALGLSLQARGHRVTVCASPDFATWVAALGLTLAIHRWLDARLGTPRALPELIGGHCETLEPFARECDVMLGSTSTLAGASFAEKFSICYHAVSFTPAVIPSVGHPSLFTQSQSLPGWANRLSWGLSAFANNVGFDRRSTTPAGAWV